LEKKKIDLNLKKEIEEIEKEIKKNKTEINNIEGKCNFFNRAFMKGYDTHFVKISIKKKSGFQAINENNKKETHIGDEVVVTNPNQVLPRFLIYFKKK
jgi:hypothetical protein